MSDCQKRVQDLLDLQLCSEGVQNALKTEDYEQAAIHIHRFLGMDQHLLKQTADDMAQGNCFEANSHLISRQFAVNRDYKLCVSDCATVTQSLKLLRDAEAMLLNKISLHFKEAVSVSDIASVKRFFKIFPLLNRHEYGMDNFSLFLRKLVCVVKQKLVGCSK